MFGRATIMLGIGPHSSLPLAVRCSCICMPRPDTQVCDGDINDDDEEYDDAR